MTDKFPVSLAVPAGQGLAGYIQAVNAAPLLSVEEEQRLARRYHEHEDLDAARELVLSHLRYVVRVARGFSGYGLPLAALVQEGNIGLMKAVKHYDPDRGVRLVSFAVHWIRAEIYDFILKNWRIVKVATTKAQRKLFFNLRKAKNHIGWLSQDEVATIAEDLNVPEKTVQEMESRLANYDVAFDGPQETDDELAVAPAAYLPDMRYNPEQLTTAADSESNRQEQLDEALDGLDARSRDIIQRRWLTDDKATLHELASEYGVSAERIRQIEKKAMEQMKGALAA